MEQHHPDDAIEWIDGVEPATEEGQVIRDVVVRRGVTRFDDVAREVAAELFSRDRRRAGGDAQAMERLRAGYLTVARRLLQAQSGTSIRTVPGRREEATGGAPRPADWRRPVGVYTALGGFMAAFQHVVQRYLFQGRPVDVPSGLLLAAYLAVAALGVRWLRDSRDDHGRTPPSWERC